MKVPGFIKRFRASKGPVTTDTGAQHRTTDEAPVPKTRRRLFTKYVALFVAVVSVALLSNGIFDVFFYYQEHKTSLIPLGQKIEGVPRSE